MTGDAIFGPVLAMLLLTLAVWAVMYVRRLAYLKAHKVDVRKLTTPDRAVAIIPERINYPAYNLKNLFELPVVFYALCVYLFVTGRVDETYVIAGWVFVVLRVAHSVLHSTVNFVFPRFLIYMAGALVLWFMLIRAALQYFG
ncbi:MAG: hypothetical protein GWN47_02570 [Woeseiaceae bacterium]|nr:hypothetical protein [Woeseiaceae bacterium]